GGARPALAWRRQAASSDAAHRLFIAPGLKTRLRTISSRRQHAVGGPGTARPRQVAPPPQISPPRVRTFIPALVFCTVSLLAPAAAVPAGSRADRVALRPTRRSFGGVRSWSQYVTMRDGVRLAADVHLPKGLAAGARAGPPP